MNPPIAPFYADLLIAKFYVNPLIAKFPVDLLIADGVDKFVVVEGSEDLIRLVEDKNSATTHGEDEVGFADGRTSEVRSLEQSREVDRPLALCTVHYPPLHLKQGRH